ncbi:hypothetical protein MRX96_055792 [Rhipicephalus microplus]
MMMRSQPRPNVHALERSLKLPLDPRWRTSRNICSWRKEKSSTRTGWGANFDHFSKTSEEWLPSFGRVWNFGRRWQSRSQYRKEEKAAGKWKKPKES